MKLKCINFLHEGIPEFIKDAWSRNLEYQQTFDIAYKLGYYIPEDQYESLYKLLNIQIALNIGHRRNELTTEYEE